MATIQKSPSEAVEVSFDFTDFIAAHGAPASYAVGVSQPGLQVLEHGLTDGVCTVLIAGGETGWRFVVGVRVTSELGRIDEVRHTVEIVGEPLGDVAASPFARLYLDGLPVYLNGLPIYLNWGADMPLNIGSPTTPATQEQIEAIREGLALNEAPELVTTAIASAIYALLAGDASNSTLGQERHLRFTHATPTVTLDAARTGLPFVLRVAPGTTLTLTLTNGAQVNGATDDIIVTAPENAAAVLALLPTGTTGHWDGIASTGGTGAVVEPPTLAITSPTVAEGAGHAVFVISLSEATDEAISLALSLTAGTATSGSDYTTAIQVSTNGGVDWTTASTVTIAAGQTSVQARVPIVDDTADESNESFTLTAAVTAGETANPSATGTATITDNDEAAPLSVAYATPVIFSTPGGSGDLGTSHSITLGRSVLNGNSLLLGFSNTGQHGVATPPAGFRLLSQQNIGGEWSGGRTTWWYVRENIVGGLSSVSFTSTLNTTMRLYAFELTGAPAVALDASDTNTAAAAAGFSRSLTTTAANALMFGYVSNSPSADPTVSAPNVLHRLTSPGAVSEHMVYRQAPTAGANTIASSWTTPATSDVNSFAIALRAAA